MSDARTMTHYAWGDGCDGWHLVRQRELSVIRERIPAGKGEVRHAHARARQYFHVLAGALWIEIDGTVHTVAAGDGIEVAPGQPHQVRNTADTELWLLVISAPPSHGDREAVAPLAEPAR